VNHYFGEGSSFVGRSTSGDIERRRAVVQQCLDGVRVLGKEPDLEVDVRVCGIPGRSLVPVDTDLSNSVGSDPRLIVYRSIQRMFDAVADYDYFLNIEDDLLIDADVVHTMISFAEKNRVNEVLLPHRLETWPDGSSHAVDLQAVPGWQGLSRAFAGQRLDVARNPHAGMCLLSAAQMRYAARRVDLDRDEQFIGGMMASAYANVHLPFLLWRTRDDVEAHCVTHLDVWLRSDVAESPSGPASEVELLADEQAATGWVDEVRVEGAACRVRGWALQADGGALDISSIRVGDQVLPVEQLIREDRPDVVAVHPSADERCGFEALVSLLGLGPGWAEARQVVVQGRDQRATLAVTGGGTWPVVDVVAGLESAPSVPDEPWMPSAAADRLTTLLERCTSYLEYGTGGTTMLASRLGVPRVTAIESDVSWTMALRHRLREQGSGEGVVDLRHVDVGPTGDWGVPVDDSGWRRYAAYAMDPWDRFDPGDVPDLVLIDGRFRVACLMATVLHTKPGTTILFDDYYDRPYYQVTEPMLTPVDRHDRMAEFVVAHVAPLRDELWRLFVEHVTDVR
jgi:hypothetical protein